MISEDRRKRRGWRAYCSEPLENIENYDKAIADDKHVWDCHHRAEMLPCGRYTVAQLQKHGLYWHRPASELIFLPHSEHIRLHTMGNKRSLNYKQTLKGKFINRPDLSKQVKMTRLADCFTKAFPSQSEAARWLKQNGYPKATATGVSRCANGHKATAYNAKWAYAN